ncbi:ATP-binding protein [Patescibacteria group bacterium]|jgi:signal transduction histidine kinase|nr:ATP-binding protein [Patescibacteria group bacterium]
MSGVEALRIASKLNAALVGVLACGTLAAFLVLETTIKPRFDEIERANAFLNHARVVDALNAATEKLQTATQDYAFWDETYRFVQGQNTADFVKSNLEPQFKAVENLGVNILIFLDESNKIQWGAAFNLETQEPLPGVLDELATFSKAHPNVNGQAPFAKRGLVRSSQGLLLISIAPVLKSDRTGIPMGRVISAKKLDMDGLRQLTGVNFSIENLPPGVGRAEGDIAIESLTDKLLTSSLIDDVGGNPLVKLAVTSPRDVSHAGAAAIRSALLLMAIAFLIGNFVLWVFLRRSVVNRIEALKSHFASAGTSGTIQRTSLTSSDDEIAELASSFNAMAEQVNHLRDALADSAYLAGLSEWAAGTLHNVRNGLAPITAAAWKIEKSYPTSWLDKVSMATSEYAAQATPDDRREKLNAYLVGSAGKLEQSARETLLLVAELNTASRNVIDMVSEFERYATRKVDVEPTDLLPLIRSSVSATTLLAERNIAVVIPALTSSVLANGIILRQILTNVLVNAAEAVHAQSQSGRVDVVIDDSSSDVVRIAIRDNGEGIAHDRLAAIFQKGESTRLARSGGLGLHWCANAIKLLGGSIAASSDGIGHGTTITIELLKPSEFKRKAA